MNTNPGKNPSSVPNNNLENSSTEKQEKQSLKLMRIEANIIQQDLAKETDPGKIEKLKERMKEILTAEAAADARFIVKPETKVETQDSGVDWGQEGRLADRLDKRTENYNNFKNSQ